MQEAYHLHHFLSIACPAAGEGGLRGYPALVMARGMDRVGRGKLKLHICNLKIVSTCPSG